MITVSQLSRAKLLRSKVTVTVHMMHSGYITPRIPTAFIEAPFKQQTFSSLKHIYLPVRADPLILKYLQCLALHMSQTPNLPFSLIKTNYTLVILTAQLWFEEVD